MDNTQITIDPQTQAVLNKPLALTADMSGDDLAFLEIVLKKINDGTIKLFQSSSLLNQEVYGRLTPEAQAKAEMDAMNMLGALREIKNLSDGGMTETFQMENTVSRLRSTKERLEQVGGDIFII